MRIVSLSPGLTSLIFHLGRGESLVGISESSVVPEEFSHIRIVTTPRPQNRPKGGGTVLDNICSDLVSGKILAEVRADLVLTAEERLRDPKVLRAAEAELSLAVGNPVRLRNHCPHRLEEIYQDYESLGKDAGAPAKGHDLAQRTKAQFMNWCDNFYERIKNKRVTFLSSVESLELAGLWIPDMIRLTSAVSQLPPGEDDSRVEWQDILDFRPDVIVVAPRGSSVEESRSLFTSFEKRPGWEEIPAVKRGEVIFTDGQKHFYDPGLGLVDSMAILLSALAGFESGYIAPKDTFYRLRWLQLFRHKL